MDNELRAITDGRIYRKNDMVKVGCHDCQGCSDCCRGMGESILLDPFDIYRLTRFLNKSFAELMENAVEIHSVEGLLLPNLKMGSDGDGSCSFLNQEGRCSIHAARPGICRLFPLGRQYEADGAGLSYFLLTEECPAKNKSKMKVEKWLDTENLPKYEAYLCDWHALTKALREEIINSTDDTYTKQVTTMFLRLFYEKPYVEDFYQEFYQRRALLLG